MKDFDKSDMIMIDKSRVQEQLAILEKVQSLFHEKMSTSIGFRNNSLLENAAKSSMKV